MPAPEILQPNGATYAYPADVFAAAVVLWELFCKVQSDEDICLLSNPLSGLHPNDAYQQVRILHSFYVKVNSFVQMINGLRPSLEREFFVSNSRLRETISSAWTSSAQERITMSQLLLDLQTI